MNLEQLRRDLRQIGETLNITNHQLLCDNPAFEPNEDWYRVDHTAVVATLEALRREVDKAINGGSHTCPLCGRYSEHPLTEPT